MGFFKACTIVSILIYVYMPPKSVFRLKLTVPRNLDLLEVVQVVSDKALSHFFDRVDVLVAEPLDDVRSLSSQIGQGIGSITVLFQVSDSPWWVILQHLTDLIGLVVLVMENKETLGLVLVLSVLELVIDLQSEVVAVHLLRLELVELVGLDVDDTFGAA